MRCLLIVLFWASAATGWSASLEEPLRYLAAVEREGAGNEAASAAWRQVVAAGPSALAGILNATGQGNAVADNWLRLAGDAIIEAALRDRQPLPLAVLEEEVREITLAAPARQLAFDLLRQADPARAARLEPALLTDPVQELRRGAVQRLLDQAQGKPPEEARPIYLAALKEVRDEDQTQVVSEQLKAMGVPVDLPSHFGFFMNWQVIGPFDNTARAGFAAVFPPEEKVDLQGEYDGKGARVKWQPLVSRDERGKLDFNKPFGLLKETTAYATTSFESPVEREAELRLGGKNAMKVWLNGELLFARDEYHRGQSMDQYRMKCRLRAGTNRVLVKCCQNEQQETWTAEWEFQLRLCDGAGTALLADASKAP